MDVALAFLLLFLLSYLGFFTGLKHLRPLPLATNAALLLGALGTVVVLWPLKVPPLPAIWPPGADFPIQLAAWVALVVGAFARVRLDRRR